MPAYHPGMPPGMGMPPGGYGYYQHPPVPFSPMGSGMMMPPYPPFMPQQQQQHQQQQNNTVRTYKTVSPQQACHVAPGNGLPYAFDIPFPDKRLPVCIRCKKNFKSRDLCRTRDAHKALPWSTTYVVVTLTDDLFETNNEGKLMYRDISVVAELQELPEMCKGPSDGFMESEPICTVCRSKNYTRDYCRKTSKHTTPSWNAVYVKLVPKTGDNASSGPRRSKKVKTEEGVDGRPIPAQEGSEEREEEKSNDLSDIYQSKTFMIKFSAYSMTVKWCEEIRYPNEAQSAPVANDGNVSSAAGQQQQQEMPPFMPPNEMGQGGITQVQMWDAFKAGAMWAQQQAAHAQQAQSAGQQMPHAPVGGYGMMQPPPPGEVAAPPGLPSMQGDEKV